ncbi:transposase, partial [Marinibactrum halimedae]|uniref:transposase n=1 Tax=Marinibactrum halimedae TaxID=1444977 RepID=UPI0032AFD585
MSEQIQHLLRQRFAPSSEKTPPNQLGLFNEVEAIEAEDNELTPEETTTEVKSHTRTRKPRVSIPDNLPREDIIYDLPEQKKTCPHDG